MKNLIISIVTIAAGFGITYYVLDSVFVPKKDIITSIADESSAVVDDNNEVNSDDTPSDNNTNAIDNEMFPEDLDNYLASKENWKDYFKENIDLSSNFIALNPDGEEIDKGDFLSNLTSGDYAPIKLLSGEEMYQLYSLDDSQNEISESIKDTSKIIYSYYTKEGTRLPEFNFTDLNGTKFTTENTKEKIIIMKCWYMDDNASIKEFKELNNLYDEYEAYEDVIFLSLAFDDPSDLKSFLIKNEFRYPVIPNQRDFIENEMEISHFPTHLIIDEEGYIEKMVGSVEELKETLKKMSAPDISEEMNQ
ncbi:TlpA disulfide reductase family protein [uncultured Tenacibaculum sp.]|uniref:TlpA family protein disulfide reductase n=1 Tax=uncultured Tenacibaculum sp. TaxID=174713 RepID=UPI002606FCD3|nr:TlpA disulfide reductase family protein [uncultured Tenacibaculum sp.]